jgi:hypothetical protein
MITLIVIYVIISLVKLLRLKFRPEVGRVMEDDPPKHI